MYLQYIDIHTHKESAEDHIIAITNRHEQYENLNENRKYSLGIHPKYITEPTVQFDKLNKAVAASSVVAIGECGLDKLSLSDFSLQQNIFQQQIVLANMVQKPLIIHCVKAFPEVLQLLRAATVPVIFHGFNRKWTIASKILEQGYYLSFGQHLLAGNKDIASILSSVPSDHLFLETDNSDKDIIDIYKAAAAIRKTSEDALILQLQNNFEKVFR